jgi:hypothetical protein
VIKGASKLVVCIVSGGCDAFTCELSTSLFIRLAFVVLFRDDSRVIGPPASQVKHGEQRFRV